MLQRKPGLPVLVPVALLQVHIGQQREPPDLVLMLTDSMAPGIMC